MNRRSSALITLVLLGSHRGHALAAAPYTPPNPTLEVATLKQEWTDARRDNRVVPVKIYYPRDAPGPFPIIIFSHGLGGSRDGYEYLGRHWAACGYVSVHLQHAGSDNTVWQSVPAAQRGKAMQQAGASPSAILNRPKDVTFAIDELTRLAAQPAFPLHARLDLKRIGVAGHSFGGWTTLAVAGQTFITPLGTSRFADDRVTAAIQMSGPADKVRTNLDKKYSSIHTPLMHMTGTKDFVPIFPDTKAEDRRIPYDHMTNSETCFVNFKDGDHMVFSGSPRTNPAEAALDKVFHPLILAGTTAFWDAYLRGNTAARSWLLDGGYAKALGAAAAFEHKTSHTEK